MHLVLQGMLQLFKVSRECADEAPSLSVSTILDSGLIKLPLKAGINRLRGGTPWQYDGKASCMNRQTVSLLYWFWRSASIKLCVPRQRMRTICTPGTFSNDYVQSISALFN